MSRGQSDIGVPSLKMIYLCLDRCLEKAPSHSYQGKTPLPPFISVLVPFDSLRVSFSAGRLKKCWSRKGWRCVCVRV